MVTVPELWLPILLSAVLAFIASSVIHMVLRYHRNDFRRLPDEDAVISALRPLNIPPGMYVMPYASDTAEMKSPEYQEKLNAGPVGFMTFMRTGQVSMGGNLAQWFGYCLVVSFLAAYVAGRAVGPGGEYLEVFRFVCTSAFLGYSIGVMQNSIWYARPWSVTLKVMLDGLIYALLTAGVFGWLWPGR